MATKTSLRDLAILGAAPAFAEPLHVGRPNIGNRDAFMHRISDLLDRRWLTNNGPYVRELEQRIAALLGVRHCVLTSSGTAALEVAIRAAGLSGEVIVPAYTFIATAHALRWLGMTPVFCDVDPHTHNIDPHQLETLLTPRTSGIIGVHLWGRPCDVERLTAIARHRDLKLLFDAAHAFGCSDHSRMVGGFGLGEIFSFHATKYFHTGEGGAVTSNDDEFADQVRLMRNFGFAGMDTVVALGTNAKMSELAAAMGLTLLEDLDALIATNYRNYRLYRDLLGPIAGIEVLAYDETGKGNYQYIVLEVEEAVAGISAADLVAVLRAEQVYARRYFYPGCHRMEPYRSDRAATGGPRLPATEYVAERVVCLPTGTAIGAEEITTICRIIRLAVDDGGQLRHRLEPRADARPV